MRRYPDFPDMRAALAAAQWAAGREGDAETNWQRVEDPRWVPLFDGVVAFVLMNS